MKTQKLKISMVLLLTWGAGFALLGGWAQGEKAENRFFGTLFFTATSNSYSLESSFTELKMDCKFEIKLLRSRVKAGEWIELQIHVEDRVNKLACPGMTEIRSGNFEVKIKDASK